MGSSTTSPRSMSRMICSTTRQELYIHTHLKCKLPYLMRCNKNYQYNNGDGERQLHDDYNTIVRSKKNILGKKTILLKLRENAKKMFY